MAIIWNEGSPFYSASSRLARGHEHISELHRQISGFLSDQCYDLVREIDPNDRSYQLLKFKFTKRLPDACTHLAAESLEALRSALDQAAYATAVLSGKTSPKRTQFPISSDSAELDNLIVGRRVCSDVPDKIVTLFRSFKPYKRSDSALWALNQLRNRGHTKLALVRLGGSTITLFDNSEVGNIRPVNPIYDSAKNEIIFGRAPIKAQLNYNVRPRFTVAFDEIEFAKGEYVYGFLMKAATEVERILVATEAECRRIGLIT